MHRIALKATVEKEEALQHALTTVYVYTGYVLCSMDEIPHRSLKKINITVHISITFIHNSTTS